MRGEESDMITWKTRRGSARAVFQARPKVVFSRRRKHDEMGSMLRPAPARPPESSQDCGRRRGLGRERRGEIPYVRTHKSTIYHTRNTRKGTKRTAWMPAARARHSTLPPRRSPGIDTASRPRHLPTAEQPHPGSPPRLHPPKDTRRRTNRHAHHI
jgi:hypothetical protein